MYQNKHVRSFKADLNPSAPVKEIGTTSVAALTAPIKVKRKVGVLRALKIVLGRNLVAFGRACRENFIPGMVLFSPIVLFALLAATATWFWFPFDPPGRDKGGLVITLGGCGALLGIAFVSLIWKPFVNQISEISQKEFEER